MDLVLVAFSIQADQDLTDADDAAEPDGHRVLLEVVYERRE